VTSLSNFVYGLVTIALFGGISWAFERFDIRRCPYQSSNKRIQYALYVADGFTLFVGSLIFLPLGPAGIVLASSLWFSATKFLPGKAKVISIVRDKTG
jgi:hypothetical protein